MTLTEKRFNATIATLMIASIIILTTLIIGYKFFPESSIMQKLGSKPYPDKIAKEYVEANINAMSNDIRVHMSFQIPALAQVNSERMTALIQDNVKFQYAEPQRIPKSGGAYRVTATAHVNIHIEESTTGAGEISGILPFLFIVDRNNRQVSEYYIQRADAYFGSNLITVSKETSK